MALVAAGPGSTAPLLPLARALARWVDVRAAARAQGAVAYLVAGAGARSEVPAGARFAVADGGRLALGEGTHAWELPASGIDVAAWPPISPHVRARWRERYGMDSHLVVDTATLDPEDVPTALAVAAAAVVAPPHLPLALALGCPSVVDTETAAALPVAAQDVVVVGGEAEAHDLAVDPWRASLHSRRARQHAVDHLDPLRTAAALLRAWGLVPTGPRGVIDERLDELGTAPVAPIRTRLLAALDDHSSPLIPLTGDH